MPSPVTGRYAQIRATLTGTTTSTPSLSDIQLECNRSSAVESKVIRYRFDEASNILEVTTDTRYGRRSDKRDDPSWESEERLNNLNQIMRQDIDGDTWNFTWDANGNLTSKTNGSESYTYVWNDENRLIQVSWDGAVGGYHAARFHSGKYHAAPGTATQWTVDYTYDSAGRMLTRNDGTNLTKFTWDHWDMVREVTGESVTEYLIPQGMLLSFQRDGVTYHASCDALGSVRLVTDEEGEVVSRFGNSAYGEQLAGSLDGVPGGMPYTWVGALGVRRDALTGLYYMRARWYDGSLDRFISLDPIGLNGGANLYSYGNNNPIAQVDPEGLYPNYEDLGHGYYRRRDSAGTNEYTNNYKPPSPVPFITREPHRIDPGMKPRPHDNWHFDPKGECPRKKPIDLKWIKDWLDWLNRRWKDWNRKPVPTRNENLFSDILDWTKEALRTGFGPSSLEVGQAIRDGLSRAADLLNPENATPPSPERVDREMNSPDSNTVPGSRPSPNSLRPIDWSDPRHPRR